MLFSDLRKQIRSKKKIRNKIKLNERSLTGWRNGNNIWANLESAEEVGCC
jgi:hypothetical protein